MSILTVRHSDGIRTLEFSRATKLSDLLVRAGITQSHPCGGRGICGKCAVQASGAISPPNAAEQNAQVRLACQMIIWDDAEVSLTSPSGTEQILLVGQDAPFGIPMPGRIGAAVDIGTTTIAVRVYDLATGYCIGQAAALNPQTTVAADVMGRIKASMDGDSLRLQQQVTETIENLIERASNTARHPVDCMVIAGNTTMLYLLTGRDTHCLATAPFIADTLFDQEELLQQRTAYLPPCFDSFVGADISCAILASGMCGKTETALLCDIGTNGEIALWKNGQLYVTATAAGPAFEGAGIRCGCSGCAGAIEHVNIVEGDLLIQTIGNENPVGICGSGIVDALAAFLDLELMDETGALIRETVSLAEDIVLTQKDVRMVQMAKSAIAAGIDTLLQISCTNCEEIQTFFIAGGFGSYLRAESAARIGLFPEELVGKTKILGNASLSGAAQLLLDSTKIDTVRKFTHESKTINLGGNPIFNEKYIEHMYF